ncbi:hypothetical protein Bbelb_101140 [Branchiostoma belcheri]|nr:hypothetical protein Bbelb_101140 [Branchiostoma belcheri]
MGKAPIPLSGALMALSLRPKIGQSAERAPNSTKNVLKWNLYGDHSALSARPKTQIARHGTPELSKYGHPPSYDTRRDRWTNVSETARKPHSKHTARHQSQHTDGDPPTGWAIARQDVKINIWHAAIGDRTRGRLGDLAPIFSAPRYAGHADVSRDLSGRLSRKIPYPDDAYPVKGNCALSRRSLHAFTALAALSSRSHANRCIAVHGVLTAMDPTMARFITIAEVTALIALSWRSHRALIALPSRSHRAPMATLALSPRSGQFQVAERAP